MCFTEVDFGSVGAVCIKSGLALTTAHPEFDGYRIAFVRMDQENGTSTTDINSKMRFVL